MVVAKWHCARTLSHHSEQLARRRTGSCTHKGLGTLGNTGLPKARAQDPVQPWIPLVCQLFTVFQNKELGLQPQGGKGTGIYSREKLPTPGARAPPNSAQTARALWTLLQYRESKSHCGVQGQLALSA